MLPLDTIFCFVLLAMVHITFLLSRRCDNLNAPQNVCVGLLITAAICNYYTLGNAFAEASIGVEQPQMQHGMSVNAGCYLILSLFLVVPLWSGAILLCGVYARTLPSSLFESKNIKESATLDFLYSDGWDPLLLAWCLLLVNEALLSLGWFELLCWICVHVDVLGEFILWYGVTVWGRFYTLYITVDGLAQATRLAKVHKDEARFEAAMAKWCCANKSSDMRKTLDPESVSGIKLSFEQSKSGI